MFDDLIGNENARSGLRRLLAAGRVPHSLLLAGPEGVGKRLFALELAKAHLCLSPAGGESCGSCSSCLRAGVFEFPKPDDRDGHRKVTFSRHPDVGTIVPYNRNILVDAVRDLECEANFRPFEGGSRFFLVDRADKMNENASNALLKTLEEPTPTSYIFLITSRPDALLPTIRSRCQMTRFEPVGTSKIVRFLAASGKVQPEDAELAARLAEGSVGRALTMDIAKYRRTRAAMLDVLSAALVSVDRAELFCLGETMNDARNKDDYETNIDILKTLVRDAWHIKLGAEASIVNVDERSKLEAIARAAEPQKLRSFIEAIEETQENFAVNINRRLATDSLFGRLAA